MYGSVNAETVVNTTSKLLALTALVFVWGEGQSGAGAGAEADRGYGHK